MIFLLALPAASQSMADRARLPDSLVPSLKARLDEYTSAQREGKWDVVALMLGPYGRGGTGTHVISNAHRECLIDQMKALPLVAFTYQGQYEFSTEILSMPPGNRWWIIRGEGTFRFNGKDQTEKLSFSAYRYNGQWYFTPPNMDSYWEKAHLTDADFAADYANEIVIHNSPKCPIEITELHAKLNKDYPSLRNLTFKLLNRSKKTVKSYTLRLYVNGGDEIYGAPGEIKPGESRDDKMDSSRYVYFCDGISKDNLIVDDVEFTDGTEWDRPDHLRSPRW